MQSKACKRGQEVQSHHSPLFCRQLSSAKNKSCASLVHNHYSTVAGLQNMTDRQGPPTWPGGRYCITCQVTKQLLCIINTLSCTHAGCQHGAKGACMCSYRNNICRPNPHLLCAATCTVPAAHAPTSDAMPGQQTQNPDPNMHCSSSLQQSLHVLL